MATVEENKTEKRSKLMEAAHSLFTSGSALKPPTIDEVVKMAGVAKGTFYLYFKDKYDLMDQLFLKKLAQVLAISLLRISLSACVLSKTSLSASQASIRPTPSPPVAKFVSLSSQSKSMILLL